MRTVSKQWSVPRHDDALERLEAALTTVPGAVLTGPDGIGKSTLARQVARRYAAAHPQATLRWVTATPTEQAVPFGAFSQLVEVAELGKPAALLRAARLSLRADPEDLLIVDDANQLDALSATLTYQLALAGNTRMIVTARADTAPATIRALWEDALLQRVDIETAGATSESDDVDAFVDALPGPARDVLDLLCVLEPIALADLQELTSAEAVREAEQLGAVEIVGAEPLVFTAHPRFAERALDALPEDHARELRSRLIEPLRRRARDHPSDRLRIAGLALAGADPLPVDETVSAAGEALRLGDLPLAERLAGSALARSTRLDARLLLAHALAWQGRGREAAEVLSAVDPAALSESELLAWALPRAANEFWMLGAPERATAFLNTTRSRLTAAEDRVTLDALTATFAMNAGNPLRALQIATEVLGAATAGDTAVAWAASAASLSSARLGRLADVDGFARRAAGAEHPGLLRFTVGLALTSTLLMNDDVDGAERIAQQYTDFAELQQPGRAIGEVLLAQVRMARGDFEGAAALLGPASAALDRTGYSWGPLSLMLSATALARLGHLAEAAKALSRAESRHGTKSALFAPELGIARAWRLAAGRDEHAAVTAARQAAGMAERSGQLAVALLCWRDAVQLGDGLALAPLRRLAPIVDCTVARAALREAEEATAQRAR